MAESIVNSMTSALTNFMPPGFIVFIISLLPILESRGGLIAASILGIDWRPAFIICIMGNLVPIPFILLFIDKIFAWLKKTKVASMVEKLENKANRKSESIKKYSKLGLFFFVAIPLPGTGAWSGALIAAMMRMKFKDALIPIAFGIVTAAVIISFISYVIPSLFF